MNLEHGYSLVTAGPRTRRVSYLSHVGGLELIARSHRVSSLSLSQQSPMPSFRSLSMCMSLSMVTSMPEWYNPASKLAVFDSASSIMPGTGWMGLRAVRSSEPWLHQDPCLAANSCLASESYCGVACQTPTAATDAMNIGLYVLFLT